MFEVPASGGATALRRRFHAVPPQLCHFRDWLTYQSGVYLNPGSSYGAGGEGRMRMNVASSRRVLREACEAMAAAVRNL